MNGEGREQLEIRKIRESAGTIRLQRKTRDRGKRRDGRREGGERVDKYEREKEIKWSMAYWPGRDPP